MVQAHPAAMSGEHQVRFFQRKFVQTVLPLVTSLVFHVGIVVIALSVVKVVTTVTQIRSETQDTTVFSDYPQSPISNDLQLPINPGIGQEDRKIGQEFELIDVDPKSFKLQAGNAELLNLNPGGGEGSDETMIGVGPGGIGKRGAGTGFGPGIGPGSGETQRGPFAPFGPKSDGKVFPSPRGARSIVYVCDATGSMTPMFGGLRVELEKEIGRLAPLQFFNVIFFSDNKTLPLSPTLLRADAAAKAKAVAFCNDTTSRGLTNPIPAIRSAFAQKPELIYVLTDGFDQVDDLESVVKEFEALNKDRKVKVNTILIGTDEQKQLVDVLQRIAKEHGGTMKIVSKEEF